MNLFFGLVIIIVIKFIDIDCFNIFLIIINLIIDIILINYIDLIFIIIDN